MERIVADQMKIYLNDNNLFSDMQSAYRQLHSTATALFKVHNDLLLAVDKGHEIVLVMLDYSAAFGTINQRCLVERFCHTFGIGGTSSNSLHHTLNIDNREVD